MKHSIVWAALLLAGCAGAPQVEKVTQIYVCAAEDCGPAGQSYTAPQLLRAVYRLLEKNDGKDFTICSSDIQSRNCQSEGVAYFVQGGPIPGVGSQASGKMEKVKLDAANQAIKGTMSSYLRFVGIPLACVPHDTTVAVRGIDEITITDEPYYCNWMAVGNMTASFSFAVESVDFDKGRIGGYWSHSVVGNAGGKGAGYAVLQFPETMPRGENWLRGGAADPKAAQ
ncbi:MAG TPA: hypothetical protein VFB08_17240 [Burkholderiales bacterium]|nr:hypothetical protein [Burkholderiales bacterium]